MKRILVVVALLIVFGAWQMANAGTCVLNVGELYVETASEEEAESHSIYSVSQRFPEKFNSFAQPGFSFESCYLRALGLAIRLGFPFFLDVYFLDLDRQYLFAIDARSGLSPSPGQRKDLWHRDLRYYDVRPETEPWWPDHVGVCILELMKGDGEGASRQDLELHVIRSEKECRDRAKDAMREYLELRPGEKDVWMSCRLEWSENAPWINSMEGTFTVDGDSLRFESE